MNILNFIIRNKLLCIIILGLIIRLSYGVIVYYLQGSSNFGDDWDYISYAKNILAQGIFVPDITKLYSNSHLVGPGFPMILAIIFLFIGENYVVVILLNAIISTLLIFVIYKLAHEIFSEKIAILSAGWAVFYVLFIKYIPFVLKEIWIVFLFTLIIYLFITVVKQKNISIKLFLLVLVFSFLIHMDERFFTYLPVLLVSFLILDLISLKNGLKKASIFFLLICLFMIPWLVRNYIVYDKIVILTARTTAFTDQIFGYPPENVSIRNSFTSNNFVWNDSVANDIIKDVPIEGLKGWRYKNLKRGLMNGYFPHKYSNLERYYEEFKEFWRPVRFAAGYVADGFRFEGLSWSFKHNFSLGITYGLLLPFFLIGCFFLIRKKHEYGIFFIVLILVHTIIHMVLAHVRNRYRIPIDPLVIIISMYGITQLHYPKSNRFLKKIYTPGNRN